VRAVRIIKNNDGTYSAYIFSHCVYTGTYENCVRELSYHNEYI